MKVKKDNIIFLNQNDVLTNLKSLLIKYPFKPYYYYNYKEAKIADLFFEHIRNQENGTYIQYTGPQKNLGFSLIKRLKFDSNIFNLKMGRITIFIDNNVDPAPFIQEICKYFSEKGYEFIDIAINSMETYLLNFFQNQGFKFINTIVTYSVDFSKLKREHKSVDKCNIRELKNNDIPILSNIVKKSFSNKKENLNRFILDNGFEKDKVGALYRKWFSNCVSGEQAEKIFVAEMNSMPIGFIACKIKMLKSLGVRVGEVPLNAISDKFRKLGIYKELVLKAFEWFSTQKCTHVEIRTQITTLAPQYVWQEIGGRLVKSEYVLHKWIEK